MKELLNRRQFLRAVSIGSLAGAVACSPFGTAIVNTLEAATARPTASNTLPPPSETATLAFGEIPESLKVNETALKAKGYSFRNGEIIHTDEKGIEWNVAKFNYDKSAVIKSLDSNFRLIEETLTADQVEDMSIETVNAGHDLLLVIKSKKSGKVSKMFLPKVVYLITHEDGSIEEIYSTDVEAAWASPIEVSDDYSNPTKVSHIEAFHTGLVLRSTQLKMNNVPWPEGSLPIRYYYNAGAQFVSHPAINDKFSAIEVQPEGQHWTYTGITGRKAGFLEYTINREKIVIAQTESLVGEDGESVIFSIGFSGEILTYKKNDGTLLIEDEIFGIDQGRGFIVYQALGNKPQLLPAGIRYMSGVNTLYSSNPNNQPWKLFPDLVRELEKTDTGNIGVGVFLDKDKLEDLQYMVLSYFFL